MAQLAGEPSAFRALVEYDGTNYAGWQVQTNRPTVQGTLETTIAQVTQQSVRVTGAGRTDAGVHASGQVIRFDVAWRHTPADMQRAINARLPADVAVHDLQTAAPGFHPRFSARSRAYRYTVWSGAVRSPLRARFAHYVRRPLDVDAMNVAAQLLVGWHDFATFGVDPEMGSGAGNTQRQVLRAIWQSEPDLTGEGHLVRFDIEANAFLRTMVRTIVAALLEVGSGRRTVEQFGSLLLAAQRGLAPPPAPACGLCLVEVTYEGPSGAPVLQDDSLRNG
jgi:tRNA pseudouridine38-40 synthase